MSEYKAVQLKPLDQIQEEIRAWARSQFGDNVSLDDTSPSFGSPLGSLPALMGIAEELGELFHAVAYRHQGRGYSNPQEHRAAKMDAVGDLMIYLLDYCSREKFDLLQVVRDTWEKVCKRRQATWLEDKAKEEQ